MEDDTPCLAVEYKLGRVCDDDEDGMKVLNTPGAHSALRKLLEVNARHAKEDVSRTSTTGMTPSYLLPLNSLSQFDIGSLCKDVGCIVCGSPSKNRCARCQSVNYCGKGSPHLFVQHDLRLDILTIRNVRLSAVGLAAAQNVLPRS